MAKQAFLALEDGTVYEGVGFGAPVERAGEVVFNTSMTGYQEVLTDPSYRGQIVAMTYPLIGNYGVTEADAESRDIWLEGFVVRELSRIASSWRAEQDLDAYLAQRGVPGIAGIDTRALTKRLRTVGALKGVISTEATDPADLVEKARAHPDLTGRDLVSTVSCDEGFDWPTPDADRADDCLCRVGVLDCGVKYNILRRLRSAGCEVTVVPATATPEEVARLGVDGLMLSNGPGDPDPVKDVITTVRSLIHEPPGGEPLPMFGICLGQQILSLALGGETFKLKFGHHGGNHPVKDLRTGQVAITTQNHGFCVDIDSLGDDVEITHVNLNDGTLEGIRHKERPLFSVQYHPEAAPGPHDARYLFDRFVDLMKQRRAKD